MKFYFLIVLSLFFVSCHKKQVPPQIVTTKIADIRIVFGYKDTRPTRFVGDRYERLYIIQDLTRICTKPKAVLCNFARDPEDGDVLWRIFSPSPTRIVKIRVKITPASVGPDDEFNRKNPYQNLQSQISENNLVTGLNSAQAVFYVGHSRDGGGPDFCPPKMTSTKDVDYIWYRENKPGIKKVLDSIKISKNRERQVFGMMSCLSSKHFEKSINELTNRFRFVSTHKLIYYTEALDQTLSEVSKVIREQLSLFATAG